MPRTAITLIWSLCALTFAASLAAQARSDAPFRDGHPVSVPWVMAKPSVPVSGSDEDCAHGYYCAYKALFRPFGI